jgi:hypothetical protein
MGIDCLTAAERRFRVWMFISAWMYALAGLFFLVAGSRIAPFVNGVSERFMPALAPYPLPSHGGEGAFWLALSLSMMAMITWICRAAYLDLRRNGRLVPVLLLSKFCSTAFYVVFFVAGRQLVHLVGALTDGPLFIATLILWLPASTRDRYMDETEEDILAAIGDALMPRGGAFEAGYADFRKECLADARRMLAAQPTLTRGANRIMLRTIDLMPLVLTLRPTSFRRLPLERRIDILKRIENSRVSIVRLALFAAKLNALLPFFNRPEIEREIGIVREEARQ